MLQPLISSTVVSVGSAQLLPLYWKIMLMQELFNKIDVHIQYMLVKIRMRRFRSWDLLA